jgi:YegS/Rv2252/BmrU family lipid kinase
MKSSIVIICNPTARKASMKRIEQATSFLRGKGFSSELFVTEERGHAERLAAESVRKGPRIIIAAGGDGTINEVVNGMVGSGIPLAVLPFGTTNVLAKELGIPDDLHAALEVAVEREPKPVCLGRIESAAFSRYFCLMAGIGVDGRAVHDTNASLKKLSGKAAYIFSGVKSLFTNSHEDIRLKINGREYVCGTAIVGKSSRYGGNFRVTPDASLLYPVLYTCIFKGRGRIDLLRYVFGVLTGRHLTYRDVVYLRSTNVEIYGHAHIQIDGDYLGVPPARISVVTDVLKIIW